MIEWRPEFQQCNRGEKYETDNEIRDIVKLPEAGKPLPEKYRFLLFEEKREVELVWNGKTNEVCNVVLSFQTIEQVDEPRAEKDVKIGGDLFEIPPAAAARGDRETGRYQADLH